MPPKQQNINIPDDKMVKLRKLFAEFDKDNSGDIDKEELALLSEKLLGHALPPKEIDELMTKMDADGGGSVNFLEFVRGAPSWMLEDMPTKKPARKRLVATRILAAEQLTQIQSLFQQSDQDGSGVIDADEFQTLLESFGVFKTPEEFELLLEQMGAGDSGELSFVQMVQRAPQWLLNKYLEQVLARRLGLTTEIAMKVTKTFYDIDVDKDTKLVRDEMSELATVLGIEATPANVTELTIMLSGSSSPHVTFYEYMNNIEKILNLKELREKGVVVARWNWKQVQDIAYVDQGLLNPVTKHKRVPSTSDVSAAAPAPKPARPSLKNIAAAATAKPAAADAARAISREKSKANWNVLTKSLKSKISRQEWEDRSWDLVLVIRTLQQQLEEEREERKRVEEQVKLLKEKDREEDEKLKKLVEDFKKVELDESVMQATPVEIKKQFEEKDKDEVEMEYIKLLRTTKRLEHALKLSETELKASESKKADQKMKLKKKVEEVMSVREAVKKDHNELTLRWKSLAREKEDLVDEFGKVLEKKSTHKGLASSLMKREMKLLQQLESWSGEK